MRAGIVACFPGVGKTFVAENASELKLTNIPASEITNDKWDKFEDAPVVIDLSASMFAKTDFLDHYIQYIQYAEKRFSNALILVDAYEIIRQHMSKNLIEYTIIRPAIGDLRPFITKLLENGTDQDYVKNIAQNWESLHKSCAEDPWGIDVELAEGDTLFDQILADNTW